MPSTEWIVKHRPNRQRPLPGATLLGQQDEWEASATSGQPVRVRTLFLRGSECRFHCTMCDLWQYTHTAATRPGDIPQQICQGLGDLATVEPRPTWLKLYNASSFFDHRNIPTEDLPEIARLVGSMQRVIVENHPRLLKRDALESFQAQIAPTQLEVAMGLETVHEEILARLNKQMAVSDFRDAVILCSHLEVATRAFVLLQTPWQDRVSAMQWCQHSIDAAREMGVQHISVIPVRGGNGALEQLTRTGDFTPPTADMLEEVLANNLSVGDSMVTVDLWDWNKLLGTCTRCSELRRARLAAMNLNRHLLPEIHCEHCDVY